MIEAHLIWFKEISSVACATIKDTECRYLQLLSKSLFCFFTFIVYHILLCFILYTKLEQMELEVREVEASTRPRLRTRVDSYRAELGRLSQEFMKVRSPPFQDGVYLFCCWDIKLYIPNILP